MKNSSSDLRARLGKACCGMLHRGERCGEKEERRHRKQETKERMAWLGEQGRSREGSLRDRRCVGGKEMGSPQGGEGSVAFWRCAVARTQQKGD